MLPHGSQQGPLRYLEGKSEAATLQASRIGTHICSKNFPWPHHCASVPVRTHWTEPSMDTWDGEKNPLGMATWDICGGYPGVGGQYITWGGRELPPQG